VVGHAEHLGGTSRRVFESVRNRHYQGQRPMVDADDPHKQVPLRCVVSLSSRSWRRNRHNPAGKAWSGPPLRRWLDQARLLKLRAGVHHSLPS